MSKYHTPSFDAEITLDSIIMSSQTSGNTVLEMPVRKNRSINAPVFVVGSPRSGTTVLGRCIGEHSECVTAEESLILLPLWRIYIDLYAGGLTTGIAHISEYVTNEQMVNFLGEFADNIFKSLLVKNNKITYVDHTPWYGVLSPFIQKIYPDARFIHVIRDGRQVVRSLTASYNKGFLWAGQNLKERIRIWQEVTLSTKHFLEKNKANVQVVYYKDLCTQPVKVLNDICNFLNISYEDSMSAPLSVHYAPSDLHSSFGKDGFSSDYTPEGWPKEWDFEDKKLFLDLAGSTMGTLFGKGWEKQIR